jgi:hypothetical protein
MKKERPLQIRLIFFASFGLILAAAFWQCYTYSHDLNWTCDTDFDRDMAFVQSNLNGHFGKDPNYLDQYLWFNPLLFSIESWLVKITGLPINIILSRSGPYLNLLGPIAFSAMVWVLFDVETALAALLSYLFLASGTLLCWASATYSPWLYPDNFMQFIFYINIMLCWLALQRQRYYYFLLLGISLGISFLGHTAPTIIIILILVSIQLSNLVQAMKEKEFVLLRKYLLQGITALVPFVLVSLPLLYFIIGKYHLDIVNKAPAEFKSGVFIIANIKQLIAENISIPVLVAIVGLYWFYRFFEKGTIRKIIWNWLFISAGMYAYTSLVPMIHGKFGIQVPDTVPSFHYFFYLKALQSVFFGMGFLYLFRLVFDSVLKLSMTRLPLRATFFSLSVIIWVALYYPYYCQRNDFVVNRSKALKKANDKDKVAVYDYFVHEIKEDKVILCEQNLSCFPLMASARKMVSNYATFSNPYVDYGVRESARKNMLNYLKIGRIAEAKLLFSQFNVSYILLENKDLVNYAEMRPAIANIVFKNNSYTLFLLHI